MKVLRQREWTEEQLMQAGFRKYNRRPNLIMAHPINVGAEVDTDYETLSIGSKHMMCYNPGEVVHDSLTAYEHWPVRMDIFTNDYRDWEFPQWSPTPPQKRLMSFGCKPYYKIAGVWAARLKRPIFVQSIESPQPVEIPAGAWLCIGGMGEPYSMPEDEFVKRYYSSAAQR